MNMRQNEVIKANLYVLLAVLVLAEAGLTAALAIDSGRADGRGMAQEPSAGTGRSADETDAGTQTGAPLADMPQQRDADAPTQKVDAAVQPVQTSTTTYALRTKDGFLQVYILETGDFYMETSIVYRLLPEAVQAQIDQGKYFDSEEELFEFLENYSS